MAFLGNSSTSNSHHACPCGVKGLLYFKTEECRTLRQALTGDHNNQKIGLFEDGRSTVEQMLGMCSPQQAFLECNMVWICAIESNLLGVVVQTGPMWRIYYELIMWFLM